jgi:hypothetical protein
LSDRGSNSRAARRSSLSVPERPVWHELANVLRSLLPPAVTNRPVLTGLCGGATNSATANGVQAQSIPMNEASLVANTTVNPSPSTVDDDGDKPGSEPDATSPVRRPVRFRRDGVPTNLTTQSATSSHPNTPHNAGGVLAS